MKARRELDSAVPTRTLFPWAKHPSLQKGTQSREVKSARKQKKTPATALVASALAVTLAWAVPLGPYGPTSLIAISTAGFSNTLVRILGPRDAAASESTPTRSTKVVTTTFKSVDATVAAQWEFPASTPAPLVIIIPASGGVDRHGLPADFADTPEIGIYAQLAEQLLSAGFAVFRYDSPGTGRSSRGRFSTSRSTALEGYTRAVDHARVDPDKVFLLGHAGGTDTIVGIYPRYEQVAPPAGLILLANRVGETDIMRAKAPSLIIVSEEHPSDLYEKGRFVAEAREKAEGGKLETELVTVPQSVRALVSEIPGSDGGRFRIEPRATDAILRWLRTRIGAAIES